MRTYYRATRGSAIAETGPSLLILLIFIFFPLVDTMQIACGYTFGWFLHNQELREASVRSNPQAGCDAATNDVFNHAGAFMGFCGVHQAGVTATATSAAANPPTQPVDTVTVDTTCTVRPFIVVPFFSSTPGLGKPIPFHFNSTANREEAGKD